MKICWIGTSYFSMAQAYDERGIEKDFVYYIAQRNPKHQFLNLSIPGVGMDHFPVRLEHGIAQDCTHFFIELPGGLRKNFISSVEETVPHPRYLRIHEYENGQRTYVQNNKDQLLLDEWMAQVPAPSFSTSISIREAGVRKHPWLVGLTSPGRVCPHFLGA